MKGQQEHIKLLEQRIDNSKKYGVNTVDKLADSTKSVNNSKAEIE